MTNRQDRRFARRQPPVRLRPGKGEMNAQNFSCQRVPEPAPYLIRGPESIAVVDAPHPWGTPYGRPSDVQICSRQICLVEGARARWQEKGKRGHITWREIRANKAAALMQTI